jgi:hypothetical protein
METLAHSTVSAMCQNKAVGCLRRRHECDGYVQHRPKIR